MTLGTVYVEDKNNVNKYMTIILCSKVAKS